MKVIILNLFFGTVLILAYAQEPGFGALSRRLAALRAWPSQRNRPGRQ